MLFWVVAFWGMSNLGYVSLVNIVALTYLVYQPTSPFTYIFSFLFDISPANENRMLSDHPQKLV